MSLDAAQRYAWNLACTLKVIIILIATDSGYQVMTSDDYDGDADKIVRDLTPGRLCRFSRIIAFLPGLLPGGTAHNQRP